MSLVIHEVRQNELMLPSGFEIKLFQKAKFHPAASKLPVPFLTEEPEPWGRTALCTL